MQIRPLAIEGAFEITPVQHADPRGVFLEWFKADVVEQAVGHRLRVAQANHSVSARGTLRGVHFADVPPSQAKYVYCTRGAVLDAVQLFRALLENAASEQGSRMTAMDNATRNAGDMINRLTITYNRTRQAAITKELIEIISGAEAL